MGKMKEFPINTLMEKMKELLKTKVPFEVKISSFNTLKAKLALAPFEPNIKIGIGHLTPAGPSP